MPPGPRSAAKLIIESFDLLREPLGVEVVVADLAITAGWFSYRPDAEERAEIWRESVTNLLRAELDERNRAGRVSRYDFNRSSEYLIQGACFPDPFDSPERSEAKRRRAERGSYQGFLTELSPTQFEVVCRGMLSEMGAGDVSLTARSADQGIDFFGRLGLQGKLTRVYSLPGVDQQLSIWMVGQAKHYVRGQAATPDIRQLVGSVQLARSRTYASEGHGLEELQIAVCDPIFYMFFTTGNISRDGWRLIKESGVIGMDGEMVAAFLADGGIGMKDGVFSPEELRDWLAQYGG